MAKHMTMDARKGMAHGLECRPTFAQMAKMFGRAVSTVADEVRSRTLWSDRGYGRTNAVCEHFDTCSRACRNADGRKTPFKHQSSSRSAASADASSRRSPASAA